MELPNKVILIKHYNEIVHYIAFYKSVKIIMELPHSIWNGFSTPPPYGGFPFEQHFSYKGASLSVSDVMIVFSC